MSLIFATAWSGGQFSVADALNTPANCAIVAAPAWMSGDTALRINPATNNTGYVAFRNLSSTGGMDAGAEFGAATMRVSFRFSYHTKPAANYESILAVNTSAALKLRICITSDGKLAIYDKDAALVATGTTVLAADTEYRIDLLSNNGTDADYALRINSAAELSGTCNQLANNCDRVHVGKGNINNNTVDFYYGPIYIYSDADWIDSFDVRKLDVTGAGNYTSWTGTYADVQTNDGDTSYISDATSGHASTFTLESAASASITGAVIAVRALAVAKDEGDTTQFQVRLRYGVTDSDTSVRNLVTSYYSVSSAWKTVNIQSTDPWALADIDVIEAGVRSNASFSMLCTLVTAEVAFSPLTVTIAASTVAVSSASGGEPLNEVLLFDGVAVTHNRNISGSLTIADPTKADISSELPSGWTDAGGGIYTFTTRTAAQLQTDLQTLSIEGLVNGSTSAVLALVGVTGGDTTSGTVTINIVSPDLTVVYPSGDSYDFGDVELNTPDSEQFVISNTGSADLVIGTVSISGTGFSIDAGDDPSDDTIASGSSGTVTVDAEFTTGGAKTGQLSIPSNDADSPYVIDLTANVPMTIAAPSDLAATTSGTTATLTWTDNADDETAQHIEANPNGTGYDTEIMDPTIDPDVETYTTGSLDPAIYVFRAWCENEGGSSDYSDDSNGVAVVNLSVAGSVADGFTLSFVGTGYTDAEYEIQVSANGSDWIVAETGQTDGAQGVADSFVVTSEMPDPPLEAGTLYYFRLRYYAGLTTLGYSGTVSSTILIWTKISTSIGLGL